MRITTVLLAGGKGTGLQPLTKDQAKPAVPFGGSYRIIDFTLSNCVNSGLRNVFVLTQFKSMSLDRHVNRTWRKMVNWQLGEFIEVVPAQQRVGDHWYLGNADAVYQNIFAIEKYDPQYVVVMAADHIYKMDYRPMLDSHIRRNADITVAGVPVPIEYAARQYGVMQIDSRSSIIEFEEKPDSPRPIPGESTRCFASMGIYVFNASILIDQLCRNAIREETLHDFGRDIIPACIESNDVSAYIFRDQQTGNPGYWRDVGTLDSFYDANMDLIRPDAPLDIYDSTWPIWRAARPFAPPMIAQDFGQHAGANAHNGQLQTPKGSIVSAGSLIGGHLNQSVVGPRCVVARGASVSNSVLLEGVEIQEGVRIRNAIVTEGFTVPAGVSIGFDRKLDLARGIKVTDCGRVVLSRAIPEKNVTTIKRK